MAATIPIADAAALERAVAAPLRQRTEGWAAVGSGSHDLVGLETMAALLANAFSVLPGHVRLIDAAAADSIGADGGRVPASYGRNLHLTVRSEAPVRVLLTGHMDTVFGVDHPFRTVREVSPGVLNGPGVADMKGGLALMLAALEAIEGHPLAPRLGYDVVINSDEETGSAGSAALIAAAARGKVAALTYEPALPDGMLAGARPGSGNFACVVRGRTAHAGRNPEDGRNAVVAAADLALRLARAAGPRLTVNPARIDGGGANNVVPDLAVLRVNIRPSTPDDERRGRAHLDAAVAMVAAEHEVAIDVHGGFGRPPKPLDPAAERLFGLVRNCGAALGQDIDWRPTGGVCDGNNIAAFGVPVVDTMGARGGSIHSADEFLILDSLGERAMLSTLVLLRLAEGGRP